MKKTISTLVLACFLSLVSTAQEWELVLSIEECEGYVYACVEPAPQEIAGYDWVLNGLSLEQMDSLSNCIDIYVGSGTYELQVSFYDWNGTVVSYSFGPDGNTLPYLSEVFFIWDQGFVEIFSDAEAYCPSSSTSNSCEKVCENTTITYTAESFSPGGVFYQWNVIGASFWTQISEFQIEVNWGEAGSGQVQVFSESGQNCFAENSLCVEILESPVADFSTTPEAVNGTLTICEGQEVNFVNESSDGVYYEWYFGDGGTSMEANPEHTYNFNGDYEVQLIARNECLCSDTTTLSILVEPLQSPFISCVGTICELDTFFYSSDADCSLFYWTVSANGTIVNGGGTADDYIEVSWTGGPVGDIELSVDNCTGDYCKSPAMIQIPIMTGNAEITGIDRVCTGAVEAYTIQDYSATYYNWTVVGGNILSGQGTNEINIEWNSTTQLPIDALITVDYENCYLECSGSDDFMVRIVDEFFALGPVEACPEEVIEFKSLSLHSNTAVTSNWSLTDDQDAVLWSFSNADLVNIPFPATPGMYLLKITATNPDDYCNAAIEVVINIAEKTNPPMGIDGEQAICPGGTYQYTAISSNPAYQFNWYVNNGGVQEEYTGNPVLITWASSGPYDLSVTQTDFERLPCESDAISAAINPIPAISLQGNANACDQDIVEFTTDFIEYASYEWEITPSDMAVVIGENDKNRLEIQWLKSGTADVKVSMCGQDATINATIHALPEPTVNHPLELCKNEEAILAVANVYTDYKWYDENKVLVSSDANPAVFPGSYELVVTDAEGCTGNTAFTIETLPLPNIRISSPNDLGICLADGDRWPDLYALDSDYGYTWQWYKDGVAIAGETGSTYRADAYATYHVEVIDVKGCKNSSNPLEVFEWCKECSGGVCNGGTCNLNYCDNPGGIFDFDFVAGAQCNEIIFTNLSTNTESGTINWNFGDEAVFNDFSTDFNTNFTYSNAGFYTVLLTGNIADLDNPGSYCFIWRSEVVTIPAAARFDIDKACPGEAVQFFDLSTFIPGEDITAWSWDFGDGTSASNTSTAQEPTHIYNNPGSYTVSLEITTATCVSIYEQVIDVYPLPEIDIIPPSVSCAGTAITFSGTTTQYVVDWSWDFGDAASGDLNVASTQESYHLYETPGVYIVTLDATNIYGCTEQQTETITIEPNLLDGQITSDNDNPMCEGETAVLTAPAGGISWLWSTGSVADNITVTESDVYSVTVTDAEGCTYVPGSYNQEMIPKPINTIRSVILDENGNPIQYLYENLEVCDGEEVHLEVIMQDDQFYVWSSGQLGPEIEYNVDRNVELAVGTYEFTVEITDSNTGCVNVIGPFEVIVHELPQDVSISSSPSGYLCGGDAATISVDNPNAEYTYLWSNGASGNSITTELAGSYFVTAFNSFGCSQESDKIEIHKGPNVGFIPDGCLERCLPDTLCLPFISGIDSYQWYYNGSEISGAVTSDLIIDQPGEYHVELTDVYGCMTTSDPFSVEEYIGTGTVETFVFLDENLDGLLDGGDTPLENIMVYLEGVGTTYLDSMLSGSNGYVQWLDVPSGTYLLKIDSLALADLNLKAYDYEILIQVDPCNEGVNDPPYFLCYPSCDIVYQSKSIQYCHGTNYYNGIEITQDTILELIETDNTGCQTITTVDIEVYDELSIEMEVINACYMDNNGSVSITDIDGGSGNYTTYINGIAFSGVLTDLNVDDYFISVEDDNGCTAGVDVSVEEFPEVILSYDIFRSCENENNGGIEMTPNIDPGTEVYIDELMIDPQEFQNLFAGSHVLRVRDINGCEVEESFIIEENPELVLELDAESSCPNTNSGIISITELSGGTGNLSVSMDGILIENNEVTDLAVGNYTVQVHDESMCTLETTISVGSLDELEYVIDTPILECDEQSDVIQIISSDPTLKIEWEDGSVEPMLMIDQIGMHTVSISNQCETIVEQIEVLPSIDAEAKLYIPNAFSPNQDGQNDDFSVMMAESAELVNAKIMILDRWGGIVHQSDDPSIPWDGMLKNKMVQPGVYVMMFHGTLNYCHIKEEFDMTSEITILR